MTSEELDAAVAVAVAQCEGDLFATVRMLLVAVDFWQALAGRLADAVSPGFVRGDPAFKRQTAILPSAKPPSRAIWSAGRRFAPASP